MTAEQRIADLEARLAAVEQEKEKLGKQPMRTGCDDCLDARRQLEGERATLKAALEQAGLDHQETRGAVAAWKQYYAQSQRVSAMLRKALEEVAHHADDECGFMVDVRAALAAVQSQEER